MVSDQVTQSASYGGDITVQQAWEFLQDDSTARLLDCRTDAEWNYVGVCDVSSLGSDVCYVPWQIYPEMTQNINFVSEVRSRGLDESMTILCLCRSGGRSRMAAMALTAAGFSKCYNVVPGFEGDLDEQGQRGCHNGWKAEGLPWRQT